MNTLIAFMMGEANRGKETMVFDWDKAARLIAQRKPRIAMAGLRGNWVFTGGVIYEDGVQVTKVYPFLASSWAVPELDMDGETVECYKMEAETPKWDAHTKWPKSAVEIYREQLEEG